MQPDPSDPARPATGRGMLWTGRVLSGLVVLMLGGGGTAMFFIPPTPDMKANMAKLGWSDSSQPLIIGIEVASAVLYAIPQTAVLGAILITAFLGGAVATHVRVGDPGWVVGVVVGLVTWLGLVLRDARLRALLPLRRI